MTKYLPQAEWTQRASLARLVEALGAEDLRWVGGCVRDTLLGYSANDIDAATRHLPATVVDRCRSAGIRTVPTGIDHGTVTAILDDGPVEITTLRRDVATDGRRATIAFSQEWRDDAARRDFTINALYAHPETLAIDDYFGGLDDLSAHRVRFIGDAATRIREDHLRILRYFRFLARYGGDVVDDDAYAACRAAANSLMALSRERIADELIKLLAVAAPVRALRLMVDGGILRAVLPEVDMAGIDRVETLMAREAASGTSPSALRRLAALLPPDPATVEQISARLKLSNKARKRLVLAVEPGRADEASRALAYRVGPESAIDRLLLDVDRPLSALGSLDGWTPPTLPISGGALIARGLPPGPDVAKALQEVQKIWVEENFPDATRVGLIADQTVSKFQRARQ